LNISGKWNFWITLSWGLQQSNKTCRASNHCNWSGFVFPVSWSWILLLFWLWSFWKGLLMLNPFHSLWSIGPWRLPVNFLISFQVWPAFDGSLSTILLWLFLGWPWFLFPWGFHLSACLVILLMGFLRVCPIQPHLRLLIWIVICSCSVWKGLQQWNCWISPTGILILFGIEKLQ